MFTGLHNVIWSRFNETIHDQSLLSSKNFTHFLTSSLNSFRFYVHYVQENHSSSRQLHEDYHIVEYSGQRSRYANPDSPPVLSSIAISAKGIVGKVEDESFQRQKEALENIITTKQTNIRLQSVEMENKQKEFHDLQRQIVTINDERKRIQQMLQYPNELKRKLQIEKRKLNDLEMKLKFNIDEEKMKLRKVYDDHITTMMTSLQEMVKNVEAYNIVIMKSQLIQLQREYKNDQLRSLQSELREANEQVRIIQGSIKLIERQRETAERDMKKAEEELNEIVEKCGGQEGFQEEYKKAKQMCPEETIQDIRDQLAVVAGELELSIDNPEVIERYEATCQELKTTEAELQTLTTSFEQSDRNLQEQSEEWLTGVRDIARKLNEGFHDYMNELQFQGEVTLKETGNVCDFKMIPSVVINHSQGDSTNMKFK
jgi:chromosome segregation ATPase